jgi:hypothetical protein
MPLPRHVPWANKEPHYEGKFDYNTGDIECTIGVGGSIDVDIDAGQLNLIYKFTVTTSSSYGYQVAFYTKDARSSDDLVFQTNATIGNYNSITNGDGIIPVPDKDGDTKLYARITGTAGEEYTLNIDMVRFA